MLPIEAIGLPSIGKGLAFFAVVLARNETHVPSLASAFPSQMGPQFWTNFCQRMWSADCQLLDYVTNGYENWID
jgi:hypothetical protein